MTIMLSSVYHGKGLSLPQLVHALNAELNGMGHASPWTPPPYPRVNDIRLKYG